MSYDFAIGLQGTSWLFSLSSGQKHRTEFAYMDDTPACQMRFFEGLPRMAVINMQLVRPLKMFIYIVSWEVCPLEFRPHIDLANSLPPAVPDPAGRGDFSASLWLVLPGCVRKGKSGVQSPHGSVTMGIQKLIFEIILSDRSWADEFTQILLPCWAHSCCQQEYHLCQQKGVDSSE